ncbi:MAG: hypothetical protein WEC75_06105 [Dehalococcoidia bacterium]
MKARKIQPKGIPSAEKMGAPRVVSGTRFPVYDLDDSVKVAKLIHERGGGSATDDELAAFLGYKSPRNGAYLGRVGAAKLFGLIEGNARQYKLSALAQKILMPVAKSDKTEGLAEAFLNAPLFKGVYEEYKGKELPPEVGLKNLLRVKFQIIPARLGNAYRALMDSAETAGFYATRSGARTHLIVPTTHRESDGKRGNEDGGRGAGDDGGGNGVDDVGDDPPPSPPATSATPKTREDLQNEYVLTLIEMLREKARTGDADTDLMSRIEKLLALTV